MDIILAFFTDPWNIVLDQWTLVTIISAILQLFIPMYLLLCMVAVLSDN